jgi:hypothetical protein
MRVTTTDAPRTDTPPPPPDPGVPARPTSLAIPAGLLLIVSAVASVAALFFGQGQGIGPADTSTATVVATVIPAVGLALAGAAVTSRRLVSAAGAAVAVGIVLADLGIAVSNLASVLAQTSAGAGSWLAAAGWVLAAVGATLAVAAQPHGGVGRPRRRGDHSGLVVLTTVVAVVLGVALLPAWDHYAVHSTVTGATIQKGEGSVFSAANPAWVVVGGILQAAALLVVPILAVLWRPARLGVLVSAGVLVVLAGQIASAVAGLSQSAATLFTPSQVSRFGLVIRPSLSPWFDLEAVAGVALLLLLVARWWTPPGGSLLDTYPLERQPGGTWGSPSGFGPPTRVPHHPAPPPAASPRSWPAAPPPPSWGAACSAQVSAPSWPPAPPPPWAPPSWGAAGSAQVSAPSWPPAPPSPWAPPSPPPPGAPPSDTDPSRAPGADPSSPPAS